MEQLDTLHALYAEYLVQIKAYHAQKKPFSRLGSLFSGKGDPEEERMNTTFYQAVRDCLAAFVAVPPTPEQAAEAAELILLTPAEQEELSSAQWMLLAMVGLLGPVIPLLSEEECRRLYDWYGKVYPRRKRLPIQEEFYRALEGRLS